MSLALISGAYGISDDDSDKESDGRGKNAIICDFSNNQEDLVLDGEAMLIRNVEIDQRPPPPPMEVKQKRGRGRPPGKRRRSHAKKLTPQRKITRGRAAKMEARQIITPIKNDNNHEMANSNNSGGKVIPQNEEDLPWSGTEFPCPHCPDAFAEAKELIMHLPNHDAESNGLLVPSKLKNKTLPTVEQVKTVEDDIGTKVPQRLEIDKAVIVPSYPCPFCPEAFDVAQGLIAHLPTHEAESAHHDQRKQKMKISAASETNGIGSFHRSKFPPLKRLEIKLNRCDGTPGDDTSLHFQALGNVSPLGNNRRGRKRQVKTTEVNLKTFDNVADRKAFRTIVKIRLTSRKSGWQCSICKILFNNKYNAVIHSRVHAGIKPYQCPICMKRFLHQGNLKQHEWIHTDKERPWKCAICSKQYTTNAGLRSHMLFHTGERPHACSFCSKRFTLSSDLTIHLRLHTGDMPHACILCPRKCATSKDLKRHLEAHSARNPQKCPHCRVLFKSNHGVKCHIAIAHRK